jgi:zinc D-Ala-D-Ala carboxypeptidase
VGPFVFSERGLAARTHTAAVLRPASPAGLFLSTEDPDDLLHPLARRAGGRLALAELLAGRDRLPWHRQAAPEHGRSAYRSPEHNRAVGGAKASKHLEGIAFDIAMTNHNPEAFEAAARAVGFQGFGFYPRSGFMHIDLGPARNWGERFPKRATAFAAETPPAREVLAESRTLKGGGAAGVATVGAAGVEVAQQVLAETQGAVLPLVPYLDTLRWLFIAVALGGIAVAIYARLDDWKRSRR